jgi:hypothetical protein
MPRVRWVTHNHREWRLSDLARAYGLAPQTLAGRLDRGLPVQRALCTGLVSRSEAGRRGSRAWRADSDTLIDR